MKWDPELYRCRHSFVAHYGEALLDFVPDDPTQRILDLGCGTGELTTQLANRAALVIGADSSPQMVAAARRAHRGLRFVLADGCALPWREAFDVIFSNAVFHWIPNQTALLTNIRQALLPGGLLICEFGACGNVATIESAFAHVLQQQGIDYVSPFYFPDGQQYRLLLEQCALEPLYLEEYDRPTVLQGGVQGLRLWMSQFFAGTLEQLAPLQRADISTAVEEMLRPSLWNGEAWVADYRRLRVVARRPEHDSQ